MSKRLALAPPVLSGYSYVRPLGTGGFADVFLFQQNMPRRLVAVKVLLSKVHDESSARALAAEADIMASLSSHPSILTVYEANVSSDGRPYLVMEYCPTSFTNRYRSERIPVAEVLTIGVKVASAVEAAHRTGLLHRDIKPSNILVTAFGQPVLSDFGVAIALAGSDDDTVAMSPPWSAPEIIEKRSSGSVASEVWALAATVYTLLAQRSPFDSTEGRRLDEAQLRSRIARAKYVPIGREDVPKELEDVLEAGMRRLPADRHPSALAFAESLQAVERAMGLQPTALEVPTEEWAKSAVVSATDDGPRGPVRSSVPVESERQRRPASVNTRTGTAQGGVSRGIGKRMLVTVVGAGVLVVGAVATAVVIVVGG